MMDSIVFDDPFYDMFPTSSDPSEATVSPGEFLMDQHVPITQEYEDTPMSYFPQEQYTESVHSSRDTDSPDQLMPESSPVSDIVPMSEESPKMESPVVTLAPQRKKARRAGKKRKSPNSEDSVVDVNDALKGMTSAELDRLLKEGSLEEDDKRRVKNMKRKIRNRESAQISRIRHRDHVERIEAELAYQKKVSEMWRDYAAKMKSVMHENNIEPPPEPVIPEFVAPPPSDLSVIEAPRASRTALRPLRTAGFCLVMLMISLGVVLNVMHGASSDNSDKNKNSLVPVSVPAPEPSARVIAAESEAPLTQLPATQSEPQAKTEGINVIRSTTYLSYDTDKEDSSIALVIPGTKQQQANSVPAASNAIVPRTGSAVMPYTTKAIFGNSKPRLADRSWTLGNTSYILVKEATEFVPRDVDLDHPQTSTEPVIGLLIPASSFNIPNLAPGDVVELVCGVKNATLVPNHVLTRALY